MALGVLIGMVGWVVVDHGVKRETSDQEVNRQTPDRVVKHAAARAPRPPSVGEDPAVNPAIEPAWDGPVMQVALMLDTSGSMHGLLDQARRELWRVVNTLDDAGYRGPPPRLEIALFEYGSARAGAEQGHIRLVQPFTDELDRVSEALFALEVGGRAEHPGEVILRSVYELAWREGPGVLRVAYVAGNEAFDQGPVDPSAAMQRARDAGITVNTIFCGGRVRGELQGWKRGAEQSGGRYFSIDADRVMAHVTAPQDEEITRLGLEINATYIPYGAQGEQGLTNLVRQDAHLAEHGPAAMVQRSLAKKSALFRNPGWDLVDAIDSGHRTAGSVTPGELPMALRGLEPLALAAHVAVQARTRARIGRRLVQLAREREAWLSIHAPRPRTGPTGLDDAIAGSLRLQAVAAGFIVAQA